MELQEVKNKILVNNKSERFKITNIYKMLKITKQEFDKHLIQLIKDEFITLDDDIACMVNKEQLIAVKTKVVKEANVICIHCVNCINKRYFNKYIDNIKHIHVSCYCGIYKQAMKERDSCLSFKPPT